MDHTTLAWAGGILGGVLGLLGGAVGTYFSIKNTNGPMEKSFMVKCAVITWIAIAIFLALMIILPSPYRFVLWVPYGIILPFGIRYGNRKQQEIREYESRQ